MVCCSCCGNDTKVRPFQEPKDEEIEDFYGPLEQRECRDIIFLVIFLAFIGGMGAVTYLGVRNGNPYRLVYGVDSWGNVCNQPNDDIPNVTLSGQDMTGKSKVFYFDPAFFTKLLPSNPMSKFLGNDTTPKICVANCPDREVDVLDLYTNQSISLCRYDITPYVDDIKKCPATPVYAHKDILNRCIPTSILNLAKSMTSTFASGLGSINMGSDTPQKIMSDLKNTWREIGYLCGIAAGVALVVVILIRFLAGVIVWALVISVVALCLAATAYCWYTWYSLYGEFNKLEVKYQTADASSYVRTWLVYAAIVSGVTIIMLLILLVMRKRISLVVQLFKEAGSAIGSMPLLLLQPLWTLFFLITALAALGLVAVFVETSGVPKVNPMSGHVKYELEKFWVYLRWYNLFAMMWIGSFIVACQDMVVAGAVATWFFCRDKKKLGCPVLKSVWRLLRYHLGSVAFGSFIIALVMLARLILAYVQKKLHGKTGKVIDFILKCIQCCLWCFERFLRYLNRNAYIEIAIYGYSFCRSAQKAFLLIVANALRVAAINSIGDFVLFLGKLCTVAIVLVIGNEFFKGREDINYIWVPISVACAVAFAVAHCFLLIYEITIDTIFLCFCEDCERNDGAAKPYFMSKNLASFLDRSEQAQDGSQTKTTSNNKQTSRV